MAMNHEGGQEMRENPQRATLEQVLVDTIQRGRQVDPDIREITASTLDQVCLDLIIQSVPRHRETYRKIYVNSHGLVEVVPPAGQLPFFSEQLDNFDITITDKELGIKRSRREGDTQERNFVGLFHAHYLPLPPSNADGLTVTRSQAIADMLACEGVITYKEWFLLFRSQTTPEYTRTQANETETIMENVVNQRIEERLNAAGIAIADALRVVTALRQRPAWQELDAAGLRVQEILDIIYDVRRHYLIDVVAPQLGLAVFAYSFNQSDHERIFKKVA